MAMSVNQFEHGISQKWKDRFQYGAAGFLIITAVALAFISFIITLTVGSGVIAWGGLSMGTALTLIGGGMYFHNQLVTFETNANKKIAEMEQQVHMELERANRHPRRYKSMREAIKHNKEFNPEESEEEINEDVE
jgi:hypothetical protein